MGRTKSKRKARKRGSKAAEIREAHAAGNAFDRMLATEDRHNRNVERKRKKKRDAARAARKAAKKKAAGPAKPKPVKPKAPFNYETYLRSAHWRATRKNALEYHGAVCDQCGTEDGLQVHHKTYARLGREKMKDLQILCADCHTKLHEADPKWVARQQKKAVASVADA